MHKQTFIVAVVPDQYNRTLASSAEAQLLHCMALSNIAGDYRCGFRVLLGPQATYGDRVVNWGNANCSRKGKVEARRRESEGFGFKSHC